MGRVGTPVTVSGLLREAEASFAAAGIGTARLDAEVLLALSCAGNRTQLYSRLGEPVADGAAARFEALRRRRLGREPVAYLTGLQEFRSLPFVVTPDVLIPRPESELLVECVHECLGSSDRATGGAATVCDVGTGSGCLAVSIARELPGVRVTAVDVSENALAVARRNAELLGVCGSVEFARGDLFSGVTPARRFDVVVSNPPYVAEGEELPAEVRHEPVLALRAGRDGLDVIRRLIAESAAWIRPGGWLLMEFGYGQADRVAALAVSGGFEDVSIRSDLAGIPRVLAGRRA